MRKFIFTIAAAATLALCISFNANAGTGERRFMLAGPFKTSGAATGAATSAAGAVTLHSVLGTITTESLSTAASGVYTLTVTNSFMHANSRVFWSVDAASSTGTPVAGSCTPAEGSAVFKVPNVNTGTAFNNAIKINYFITQ